MRIRLHPALLSTSVILLPILLVHAFTPSPINSQMEWMGRIVVEVQEDISPLQIEMQDGLAWTGNAELDHLARQFNVYHIEKLIPWATKPENPAVRDISRYYIVEFPPDIDIHAVVAAYAVSPVIITADPYRVYKNDYVPNDPYFGSQWAMSKVGAATAYNFCQGSPSVIIGVVDSGIDTAHVDLRDNLWVNPGEDLNQNGIIEPSERNNVDDDGNYVIDDFWGANWINVTPPATTDNNVQDPLNEGHGSHCAGDANAVTDNGTGIASLGFKSKIMAARVSTGGYIYYGGQGIAYCVTKGAKVISLSYGGTFWGAYENSMIQNAWANGCVIVAAAGNDTTTLQHFPAAYENVVAVAATDQNDYKVIFSNWGSWVDVCAPGVDILSTIPGGGYASWAGTSMACPITAGLCAMIWAAQPTYTNDQVVQHLFNTCVNIDALNPSYAHQLGHGRINAANAITTLYPQISVINYIFSDSSGNNDGRPDPGETVQVFTSITNSSLTISAMSAVLSLTCSDPDIALDQDSCTWASIAPQDTIDNYNAPFSFIVSATAQTHETEFLLKLNYQSLLSPIEVVIPTMIGRPSILVMDDDGGANYQTWYDGDLDTLAYVHDVWNENSEGEISQDELLLYPITIWHTSNTQNPLSANEQSLIQTYLSQGHKLLLTGENIDEQLTGTAFYSDILHAVSLNAAGFFKLQGIAGEPFTDGDTLWLLGAGGAGVCISPSAIDTTTGSTLLYTYTSTSQGGALRWESGDTKFAYFAFCFESISGINGTTQRRALLSDLLDWFGVTTGAQPNYPPSQPSHQALLENYPNPFNATTQIRFNLPTSQQVNLSVYDLSGRLVETLVNAHLPSGNHRQTFSGEHLTSGLYLVRLQTENGSITQKLVLLK